MGNHSSHGPQDRSAEDIELSAMEVWSPHQAHSLDKLKAGQEGGKSRMSAVERR